MRIATWNLERLIKHKNDIIAERILALDADILILTETSSLINLPSYFCVQTESLPANFDGIPYKYDENRVTILSRYKPVYHFETYDSFTSVCIGLETPLGLLRIYGTIIGVFGGRGQRFEADLYSQILDFESLLRDNNCCIAGDFNVTFSGYVYPSRKARDVLNKVFSSLNLINTTKDIHDNVDHIVLNSKFVEGKNISIEIWNEDKKLSDHIGVCLTIS